MTRLAFVDLDGTLLGPDRRVSAENERALARLRAAGCEIVLASGRHHRNILALAAVGADGWILSSHGVVVRHARSDEAILEMGIAFDDVVALCRIARDRELSVIAYHRDGAFIEARTRWTETYAEKTGWSPPVVRFDSLDPRGFQKVLLSDEPARIAELHASLPAELSARHHAVITEPELLELLARGANKATGAAALAARLGASDTLAFGDGNNDVELLAWAGRSVAMAHGREAARRAAKHVTEPGAPETAFARAVEIVLA
ncbi:MAG: Cof-type HAD-IIB family hydrolase [Labilithrix sp.]|nr:Cof-type HAD-IIB family hydrolase [Labilithrix sp.]MCW5817204.1 Cof-type HAD-IIB family hydrolase [Labilithrix sp.]